jgi:ABC-2 type transport system ATP-binding protein
VRQPVEHPAVRITDLNASTSHGATLPARLRPVPEPVVRLRGVEKRYGDFTALAGVDLDVAPGEILGLLGPNGAGKTTAVRLLLGTSRPSAGEVRLFGANPSDRGARQHVGMMLQVGRVPETLTPREHLTLFRSYYPEPLAMNRLLAATGITGIADRRFGTLSGGERQRVLFAAALCGNPHLLFLDEPTVGLDIEARHLFWDAIRQMIREGRSVLLTTHYLEEADALADRVVVLQRGRVVADGTPAGIKQLVAGRQVRCVTQVDSREIEGWPSVRAVRSEGSGLVILTSQAETVARELLARDPTLSELEVSGINLEDAFVALTGNRSN